MANFYSISYAIINRKRPQSSEIPHPIRKLGSMNPMPLSEISLEINKLRFLRMCTEKWLKSPYIPRNRRNNYEVRNVKLMSLNTIAIIDLLLHFQLTRFHGRSHHYGFKTVHCDITAI